MLKPFILQLFTKPILSRNCKSSFSSLSRKVEIIYKDIDKAKYEALNQCKESHDIEQQIDEVLQQYEHIKYINGSVPSDLSVSQMSDLLSMRNSKEREVYIRYLFLTESRKIKDRLKKMEKKAKFEQYLKQRPERELGIFEADGKLRYDLWSNSIMSRLNSRSISKLRTESKLRYASLFGQKLIIDLDYDDYMSLSEARIQIRHIVNMMVENIRYNEPFDIYFTNCDRTKPTMIGLEKYMTSTPFAQLSKDEHFLSQSYMERFDPKQLIYLSPNATESLKEYDHDAIYIIGGFLDKSCLNKPISHIKATNDGIRQYRLPLDEYVIWGSGSSKHLCILHMVAILNSLKDGADWSRALHSNIPKRKIKSNEIVLREEEQKRIAYLKRKLSIETDFLSHDRLRKNLYSKNDN